MSEICNVSGRKCACLDDGECTAATCNYKQTEYCEYAGDVCENRINGLCRGTCGEEQK